MRTKTPRTTHQGGRKKEIMKVPCSTKLHPDTYRYLKSYVKAHKATESEAIRDILDDWFRIKRVEALEKDETSSPVRKIYERVIDEKLQPLTILIEQLKSSFDLLSKQDLKLRSAQGSPSHPGESSSISSALQELKILLEETGSSLNESATLQMNQLEEMQISQETMRSISCETFASNWSILDLLIRYLVEADLRAQGAAPGDVEKEVTGERRMLRLEGLQMIARIEDFLKLPQKLRLAQFVHAPASFPLSRIEPGQTNQEF